MQQYTVTGMHCAACSASVEKAVKKVPGVTSCAVSLLTNSMGVEGTAEPAAVIKAVEDAGYGASVRGQEAAPAADASALEDRQTPHLKKRLIASVAFLLILMYFSMGHMMWGWPLPSWFDGNHVAMGLVQLLLAGIVMVINQEFFEPAARLAEHGHACLARRDGILWVERLRAVRHDGRAAARRQRGRHGVYGRILF